MKLSHIQAFVKGGGRAYPPPRFWQIRRRRLTSCPPPPRFLDFGTRLVYYYCVYYDFLWDRRYLVYFCFYILWCFDVMKCLDHISSFFLLKCRTTVQRKLRYFNRFFNQWQLRSAVKFCAVIGWMIKYVCKRSQLLLHCRVRLIKQRYTGRKLDVLGLTFTFILIFTYLTRTFIFDVQNGSKRRRQSRWHFKLDKKPYSNCKKGTFTWPWDLLYSP